MRPQSRELSKLLTDELVFPVLSEMVCEAAERGEFDTVGRISASNYVGISILLISGGVLVAHFSHLPGHTPDFVNLVLPQRMLSKFGYTQPSGFIEAALVDAPR